MTDGYRVQTTTAAGLTACTLHDDSSDLHATWVPEAGMLGGSLIHRGQELLWQGEGVSAYAAERKFMGIPFLHPWANRIGGFGYRIGSREITLDRSSPVLKLDENGLPIHGLLNADPHWSVGELTADGDSARLAAFLDFDRDELLAAFPFEHRVEIEVRVQSGQVAVQTTVTGMGDDAVPIAFGFHPYLQLPGAPRAEWEVSFPVRRRVLLDARQIPTDATEPVEGLSGAVGDRTWDDEFDQIEPPGRFEIRGAGRTISLNYDEGFPVAQIFAPPGQEYLCVEPMTARANALQGPDSVLQWVAAGQSTSARFTIAVS
jgi:aldose 1-epimerase